MTDVELIWIETRLEHRIRFGRVAAERIVSARTRVVSFRPHAVFALVRCALNEFGVVHARIDIVRTARIGEVWRPVPFVRPGGELLLSVRGLPGVDAVLAMIDAMEADGVDPCEASPDHWRHVHNRLTAGERPRPYTVERHAAWLKRKAAEQ
jgi:hypothetical protein